VLHGELIGVFVGSPTKLSNALFVVAVDKVTAGLFKILDSQNSGFSAILRRQLTFLEFLQSERGSIPDRI
jgi:hypothetical protein